MRPKMTLVDFVTVRRGTGVALFRRNNNLFPLFEFRRGLRRRGIAIRFATPDRVPVRNGGAVLCLDSRAFSYRDGVLCDQHLELLAATRNHYDRILWFDNRDSTGTTQFEVLPYVDKYCKKQYLRDKSLYQRQHRGGRIYTDYLSRRYGLDDDALSPETVTLLDPHQAHKLVLSWNLAYSNFHPSVGLARAVRLFSGSRAPRFCSSSRRPIDLQARFATDYGYDLVSFQRHALLEALKRLHDLQTRTGRVSLREYRRELSQTRAVLSPFGAGEICYRDFEAMIFGCALVKPSVSHLETWPDLFRQGETYIDLPWEIDDAIAKLEQVLRDKPTLDGVAQAAQREYQRLWGADGETVFHDHFLGLVEE